MANTAAALAVADSTKTGKVFTIRLQQRQVVQTHQTLIPPIEGLHQHQLVSNKKVVFLGVAARLLLRWRRQAMLLPPIKSSLVTGRSKVTASSRRRLACLSRLAEKTSCCCFLTVAQQRTILSQLLRHLLMFLLTCRLQMWEHSRS